MYCFFFNYKTFSAFFLKNGQYCPLFHPKSTQAHRKDYLKRKTIGTLAYVRTGLPEILPGTHLGIILTIRAAPMPRQRPLYSSQYARPILSRHKLRHGEQSKKREQTRTFSFLYINIACRQIAWRQADSFTHLRKQGRHYLFLFFSA